MSNPRIVISLAAIVAALVVVLLLPGGSARPLPVSAADCDDDATGTIVIEIFDRATSSRLTFGGADLLITPDPHDFSLDHIVVDSDSTDASGAEDKDPAPGVIRIEDACSTEGAEFYTAILLSLPGSFNECDIITGADAAPVPVNGTADIDLEVDCTGILPTPTVAPTATPAVPAQVTVAASPVSVACSGSSVLTVEVRDGAGNLVKPGTAVTISTSLGAISPASGHTTNDEGKVVAFFSAPAATGGGATITATAGAASGVAFVAVNCSAVAGVTTVAATATPPPAPPASAVIRPPNTGDAGLTPSGGDSALIASTVIAVMSLFAVSWLVARRLLTSR